MVQVLKSQSDFGQMGHVQPRNGRFWFKGGKVEMMGARIDRVMRWEHQQVAQTESEGCLTRQRLLLKLCAVGFLLAGAAGCSVEDLERKISRLERSMGDMRAYQAEQTETINSLDSQVKVLSGRMEELEFAQNKRLGSDLSALKADLNSLRRRVPPPAIVPVDELEVDEVWAKSLPEDVGALFFDGLSNLREGRYDIALPLFQNAAEQLNGSDRAGVALFWQGVTFDGMGDDRGALRAYAEVVSRYAKSSRAPTSLLRQSFVLNRLGDKKAANLSLRKLVEDYPRSLEAGVAKERLK
jgi:TolA-binding protein